MIHTFLTVASFPLLSSRLHVQLPLKSTKWMLFPLHPFSIQQLVISNCNSSLRLFRHRGIHCCVLLYLPLRLQNVATSHCSGQPHQNCFDGFLYNLSILTLVPRHSVHILTAWLTLGEPTPSHISPLCKTLQSSPSHKVHKIWAHCLSGTVYDPCLPQVLTGLQPRQPPLCFLSQARHSPLALTMARCSPGLPASHCSTACKSCQVCSPQSRATVLHTFKCQQHHLWGTVCVPIPLSYNFRDGQPICRQECAASWHATRRAILQRLQIWNSAIHILGNNWHSAN